jgi:hypothetical protein
VLIQILDFDVDVDEDLLTEWAKHALEWAISSGRLEAASSLVDAWGRMRSARSGWVNEVLERHPGLTDKQRAIAEAAATDFGETRSAILFHWQHAMRRGSHDGPTPALIELMSMDFSDDQARREAAARTIRRRKGVDDSDEGES